jgi:hypothetical protein
MSRYLYLILTVMILSCSGPGGITAREAAAAIDRFDQAWYRKDSPGVDSILAPSYMYFTQSGGVFDRASLVRTAGSPSYRLESMNRDQVSIVIQGNTAVVNTIWTAKGIYNGVPFNDRQRCSLTLIKENGQVRILSEHCTPIR